MFFLEPKAVSLNSDPLTLEVFCEIIIEMQEQFTGSVKIPSTTL